MNTNQFNNLQGELESDYPLARHTSWRVGGRAEFCYRPANLADLENFLAQIPQEVPLTWLGLGSNVLIRDAGIKGVVILTLNRLNEITLLEDNLLRVEAGVTCAKLSKYCVRNGFESGAFFAGIPGTVGGALAMNAGAFKGETWVHVEAVEVIDRFGKRHKRLPQEFDINYRQVLGQKDEYFVAGYFRFEKGDSVRAQQDLRQLLQKRNSSQPIGTYSCGSVFRNPAGDFAARLVEQSGLKGYRIGQAEVSKKHANFILNTGDAKALDIENLIHYVADQVWQQQGVKLVPEVHILGEKPCSNSELSGYKSDKE